MAYHYVLNTLSGEKRRILTASLPTYQGAGNWAIFDTEQERENFQGPDWYRINYVHRYPPEVINAMQARTYWTESHRRAGWGLFHTVENARAAFEANQPRYSINVETGDIGRIQTWLAPEERTPTPGYIGDFENAAHARDVHPAPFYCLHPDGMHDSCYPQKRQMYIRDGYIVDVSREACEARLPVRWKWHVLSRKYQRAYSGSIMSRPSNFAELRAAIRALKEDQSVFRLGRQRDYYTKDVLQIAQNAVFTRWNAQPGHDGWSRPDFTRDFVERVNKLAGASAVVMCGECHANMASSVYSGTHQGQYHCADCAENFVHCYQCNVSMRVGDALGDRGRHYCEAHWAQTDRGVTGELAEYNADVTRYKKGFLKMPGERGRELWLGFELECHAQDSSGGNGHDPDCEECEGSGEYRDGDGELTDCECEGPHPVNFTGAIRKVQETAGAWALVKSDGSLATGGMEIVSVPASLAWHTATVKPWLETAKSYLSGWEHNDCGIHVHVGIKQLTPLTQGKLLTFMHDDANQAFITALAGRDTNSYCVRGGTKKKIPAYRREDQIGRYQCLNFQTRGKKTVEFRIFRSNVSPAGFMKNLEFVHALCSWARLTSMQDVCNKQAGIKLARTTQASENFIAWVKRERSQYPHLVRWFETSGFLPKPRVHPDLNLVPATIAA